ncbi:WG repeat-containing protein [Pseudomonas sp. PDNC002]|uniref:WG repeat-containing protein n=1 Tax=Pseudomonas sp. PDNC002 TaxID=2811422 RepID=UPI0019649EDF|nr:WG repeat-containing protein [Pseudomonas sp. PDNC002]QRY79503.1 WG repeat-containing protein [Pseudomonas sp. PDNC002]
MDEKRIRHWLIALGALVLAAPGWAADESWIAFSENDLIGFKDAQGRVKIAPTLSPMFTLARRFDRIIATGEETASGYRTYHLLRDGRQVAADSLYFFDNAPICESEDSIRFRDRARDMVGFLDGNGQVVIPARLNDATAMRNGMAVALVGATRSCADPGVNLQQCEHKGWKGGTELLIDRHGSTLVEGFDAARADALDWFSLETSAQPSSDPRRVSFKGVDGRYYSFVDIEKDFAAWFRDRFLPHLDDASLKANSLGQVWTGQGSEPLDDWKAATVADMLRQHGPALRKRLEALRASGGYGVRQDDMGWPFDPERDPQYFDNCGEFAAWKTPKMSVMEHWEQGSFEPDKHASFDFIRTAEGYRLVAFSLPTND